MSIVTRLTQSLRSRRDSPHALVRLAVAAAYGAREWARRARAFVADPKARSVMLVRLLRPRRVHQTTVLTWMDRYPVIFSACRDSLAGRAGLRILSFGCSTGEEVLTLRRYFPAATIVGAEINPRSLATCRRLQVDERIEFIDSNATLIARRAPFDAIFCMAVLQRTPHLVEEQALTSLADVYPFAKFDRQLTELDGWLAPQGLLVVRHAQYLVRDATIADRYDALPGDDQGVFDGPRFDRESRLIPGRVTSGSIFVKRLS